MKGIIIKSNGFINTWPNASYKNVLESYTMP